MGKAATSIAMFFCVAAASCATGAADDAGLETRVAADDPAHPRAVRFEVPTAYLMGLPGQYELPLTAQARIATRELAARELALRGYCPYGFDGPEGLHFSPDRSRSAFEVRCR